MELELCPDGMTIVVTEDSVVNVVEVWGKLLSPLVVLKTVEVEGAADDDDTPGGEVSVKEEYMLRVGGKYILALAVEYVLGVGVKYVLRVGGILKVGGEYVLRVGVEYVLRVGSVADGAGVEASEV